MRWAAIPVYLTCLAGCLTTTQETKVQVLNRDGVQMYSRGDYRAARDSFEQALELTPRNPALLYNLGQCNDRLGDNSKAESFYVQCLQSDNNHTEARDALGKLYYRQGRNDDLRRLVDEWIDLQPQQAQAYVLEGWRLRQDKDYPGSLKRLQQALAIEPHNPAALTEMGVLYESMDMPDRSRVLYERSLAQKKDQPEVVERLEQLRARSVSRPLPLQ